MFDKLWKSALIVLGVALLLMGVRYFFSGEDERELTPLMRQLAQTVASDLREQLPRDQSVNRVLLLIPARGPRSEEKKFRALVQDEIVRSDKYSIETWEYVKDAIGDTVIASYMVKLGLQSGDEPDTFDRAKKSIGDLRKTANLDLDGILYVDVKRFNEGPDDSGLGAEIAVQAYVYSIDQKKTVGEVKEISHSISSGWDIRYMRHVIQKKSWILRFLGWVASCALLPWLLIAVVRAVLRRKDNQLNIMLLVLFTLVDLLLMEVLVNGLDTGGMSIFLLVLGAAGMGYYNFDACDYIERRLL